MMLAVPRAFGALIAGLLITVIMAVFACVGGVFFKILNVFLQLKTNPARYVFHVWAFLVDSICAKFFLKINTIVEGNISSVNEDEVVVCIANHPSTIGIPKFLHFVTKNICKDILAVGKREHLLNPFVGWPLWLLDAGIFVNRKNPTDSGLSVCEGVRNFYRRPSVIIVFPDMRRPSKERIRNDREKFFSKILDIDDWLKHTMIPRAGALHQLVKNLTGLKVRLVNITISSSNTDENMFDIFGMVGSNVYIKTEEIPVPSGDIQSLRLWLNNKWRTKNRDISTWKGLS